VFDAKTPLQISLTIDEAVIKKFREKQNEIPREIKK